MTIGHTSFFHIYTGNVYVCAVTRQNVNAALVFELLRCLVEVFKDYFGDFDENSIKNNFSLMYELLDEVLDFGYPQRTESEVLKTYITQQGVKSASQSLVEPQRITMQATGAMSWRKEGIRYKLNELFIDVIETVNMLLSHQGVELSADVQGSVMINCHLSGMPECKFGVNDKLSLQSRRRGNSGSSKGVDIDDISFHQCVRLGGTDKGITFVPPDGEFELMKYRLTSKISPPFKLIPIVRDLGRTRIEAKVVVKSLYKTMLVGNNIEVRLPCPSNTARVKLSCSKGKARFKAAEQAVIWRIKKLEGQKEVTLSAEIEIVPTTDREQRVTNKAPISMKFE
ncbi:AP-2 complex subunit mu, partial [Sphaeroforma arctica JP610]